MEEYTYQFMELARYAPEEVDKDEKKKNMFKKGLNPELWTLLTPQIYPNFNTLMNMVILTERAKVEERKQGPPAGPLPETKEFQLYGTKISGPNAV